jgi:hypothetical protein
VLHRRLPRPAPAHPETADVAGPEHGDGDGDGTEGTPDRVIPPASLDQVLRRAAEAREAERDPDD